MDDTLDFRCVTHNSGQRCIGRLRADASTLRCEACGHEYAVIGGVPILLDEQHDSKAATAFYETYMHAQKQHIDELREWAREAGYCRGVDAALRALVESCDVVGPSLEIGAAGALFADTLPGYIALEYSLRALSVKGFEKYRRVCASAACLPFADESMGFVLSINTLEHVADAAAAFDEIDRVLKPGGVAYLHPAWNCARYVNELLELKPYHALRLRQKATKALIPVLKSTPYKIVARIPPRVWRRVFARRPTAFRFRPLDPNYGPEVLTDQDAAACIDPAETVLFFLSRGYRCMSHPTLLSQLTTGHRAVVVQKSHPSA